MKDLKYRDDRIRTQLYELETGFDQKLANSIEELDAKLTQLLEDKIEEMGKENRRFT